MVARIQERDLGSAVAVVVNASSTCRRIALRVAMTRASARHRDYAVELTALGQDDELGAIELTLACERAWVLDDDRALVPLRARVAPPFPVGTFAVIQRGGEILRVGLAWASRLEAERRAEGCRLTARVQNRAACGLSAWSPDKLSGRLVARDLEITVDVLTDLEECVWVEPYPGGARGVVCLTDHPDFDTTERLTVLTGLFGDRSLVFTKGVFPRSDPRGAKAEPGLDVAEYRAGVETLHAAGSEIAFHGFGPRVQAPPIDECRRRCDALLPYRPSTWIDHGTGAYLFSRTGMLQDGTRLLDLLRPLGVHNFWSYTDLWDNPTRELSCWSPRRVAATPADLVRLAWRLRAPAASLRSVLSYPAVHALRNAVGADATELLRAGRIGLDAARAASRYLRGSRARRAAPLLIYGLNGAGYALHPRGELVFDSVVLNHPAIQLRGEALVALSRRSGLLIAHTYLCACQPYLAGGCFEPDGTVSPAFVAALDDLAAAQRAGAIITLPFARLRAQLVAHAQVRLERTETGWMVSNPSELELQLRGPRVVATSRTPVSMVL